MSNAFTAPHFQSHEAAREWFEAQRWPNGPVCPHCGSLKRGYTTKRAGLYRCAEPECRKDFSVTVGTVMERSRIPLHKWAMGFFLMASSKKGVSAHQLHRSLGIGYEAAWFMAHRIREAMRADASAGPLGGEGMIVEADETYYGKQENPAPSPRRKTPYLKSGGGYDKRAIVSLVERGGSVRSFHVAVADKATVTGIIKDNIAPETKLFTDESRLYGAANAHFAEHQTVKHSSKEYVRGEVHTNTIEGYFGVFKKGMKGVYQHCREKHLHRYLAEFDFRHNHRVKLGFNDTDRTLAAVRGAEGKRLLYKQPSGSRLQF